jgi:antitoxin MazE
LFIRFILDFEPPAVDTRPGAILAFSRYNYRLEVIMETKVQKWGNSLAVRIPKAIADQLQIEPNSAVELVLSKGKLVIIPVQAPVYTLEELLEGMTAEMLHSEVDTGTALGAEEW